MTALPLAILHEQPDDAIQIERLQDRAFGPGRYARTAYRLREGVEAIAELSFVARVGAMLVGSNRMTPIRIGPKDALLLGPLVVDPAFRLRGVGRALITASLEASAAADHGHVLLVGDEPYYGRLGFARVPEGRIAMPGPVDPARLLWRALGAAHGEGVSGAVKRSFRR